MNTNIEGSLGQLTRPFFTMISGILAIIKRVNTSLNSIREAIAALRVLFQAFIGNTMDKLSNSYVAMIYFREKMKHIIKRQTAVMEIMTQFLAALPFLFYSLSNGPLPRFANWFLKYSVVLIAVLAICLLCIFGGPFVAIFACPICALCFTEDSIVGTGDYKKRIIDIEIGDYISKDTYVTGKIHICSNNIIDMYKVSDDCIVSGSHSILIDGEWMRVKDMGIEPSFMNEHIVCLITNNNIIPTDTHIFKDYMETSDKYITHRQMNTVEANLNNCNTETDFSKPVYPAGFSYETIMKMAEDVTIAGYGFVEIEDDNIEWYEYEDAIVSGTLLVKEDDKWIRVYNSSKAYKVENDENRIYNLITEGGTIEYNNVIYRDYLETHDKEVWSELLRQLDNYHNK
jgi:predicted nucleic-acid-binding Zn-ribbon protein